VEDEVLEKEDYFGSDELLTELKSDFGKRGGK